MKIVKLIQGTPEWLAHRRQYFNASDAAVMLGLSPYKTRAQLIEERVTGLSADIDDATQRIFDQGHRFEALARPIAEKIIGEDLYPCVGIDGKYSASFDGLTMAEDLVFEHKTLNKSLRGCLPKPEQHQKDATGEYLPEHYRAQLEHQLLVSGAPHALFMASTWENETLIDEKHCLYNTDPKLRERIIAGWEQFEADCAAYLPRKNSVAVAVSRPLSDLPVLNIDVTGTVLSSNFDTFKEKARNELRKINRDLKTDADFISDEQSVKWCKNVEDKIDLTKEQSLSKMVDVFALFNALDEIKDETRRVRLDLERNIKTEKESRRNEIIMGGVKVVKDHYANINASLGMHSLALPQGIQATIGASIKGRKTIDSIQDAVQQAVANLKIDASQKAEKVRANIAILNKHEAYAHLFADRVSLCDTKEPDDLRNLISIRIDEYSRAEQERLNAERLRVQQAASQRLQGGVDTPQLSQTPVFSNQPTVSNTQTARSNPVKYITITEINDLINPLRVDSKQLASLGVMYADIKTRKYTYKSLVDFAKALRERASYLEHFIKDEAA